MPSELNKYRLLLGYGRSGKYVAAPTPEAAVAACFPNRTFSEKDLGSGWVRYKCEQELPKGWPNAKDGVEDGGGNILDVEKLGTILVTDGEDG